MIEMIDELKNIFQNEGYTFLYENIRRKLGAYNRLVPGYKDILETVRYLPTKQKTLLKFFACGCIVDEEELSDVLDVQLINWLINKDIAKKYEEKIWMNGFLMISYKGKLILINSPTDYENYNPKFSGVYCEGNLFSIVDMLQDGYNKKVVGIVNDEFGIISILIGKENLIYLYNEQKQYEFIRKINVVLNKNNSIIKCIDTPDMLNVKMDICIVFLYSVVTPAETKILDERQMGKDKMAFLPIIERQVKNNGSIFMAGTTISSNGKTAIADNVLKMYGTMDVSIYYQEEVFVMTHAKMLKAEKDRESYSGINKYKNAKCTNFVLILIKRIGEVKEFKFENSWNKKDIPKCKFKISKKNETKYIVYRNGQGLELPYSMYKWIKEIDGKKSVAEIIDIVENSIQDQDIGIFEREGFVANLSKLQQYGLVEK